MKCFSRPILKFGAQSAVMFAMACGLALSANAQSIVIVNDDFLDGSPLNSGQPLESQFFTTSSGSALDDSPTGDTPGTLEFATGSSGRAIHSVFPTQNLTLGDMIFASIDFTTPATVGSDENNGLRFGIFNEASGSLATDVSASSGTPNPLINVDGFSADYDVNDLNGGVLDDEVSIRQATAAAGTGRLLTTTSGFNAVNNNVNSPTGSNGFVPNSDYTVSLKVTRISGTDVQIDTELLDGAGVVLNGTTGTIAATSFDFSTIGLLTSSGAFGSSSSIDDPDNGLRLTNAFVEVIPTAAVVPEPSSLALLGLMGCAGFIRRRR